MTTNLSETEQVFIVHGAEQGIRNDGRSREDYRPIKLETGLLSNTNGSARIRLGRTDVLVGIKGEIEAPEESQPNKGRLQFFVDCSANATPEFEGRGGEEISQTLMNSLASAYSNPIGLDYDQLCLKPGHLCWTLYVDVVLLELSGNLFDAVSLAVKAALFNVRLPNLHILFNEEKDKFDCELTDDYFDLSRLNIEERAPLLVTVAKIGNVDVIDPTDEEGFVSQSSIVVGVAGSGGVSLVQQTGRGSLDPDSVSEMLNLGMKIGQEVNNVLLEKLKEDEKGNDSSSNVHLGSSFLAD